jgi:hypothetical protein
MGDVIPFQRKTIKPRSLLCANNHHRWVASKNTPFASKQGKLVTVYKCERCGIEKTEGR